MEDPVSVVTTTSDPELMPDSNQLTYNPSVKSKMVFSIELLLSVVTVGLNVFILIAFYSERKLRTYSNQYILNITISDLLVGFVMAIRSTFALYGTWIFGEVLFYVYVGIQNTLLGVSVLGVIAICIDRYVATRYPIQHFQRKSKRIAHIVNAITWAVSICFWIPITTVWDLIERLERSSESIVFNPNYGNHVSAIVGVTLFRMAIPFALILILYVKICLQVKTRGSKHLSRRFNLRTAKVGIDPGATAVTKRDTAPELCRTERHGDLNEGNHCNTQNTAHGTIRDDCVDLRVNHDVGLNDRTQIQTSNSVDNIDDIPLPKQGGQGKDTLQITKERTTPLVDTRSSTERNRRKPSQLPSSESSKVMLTLTFIVVAFFVTWLPNAVNLIYSNVKAGNFALNEVTRWITFSNSMLNPVAYAMAQPLFRTTILRILRCRR